MRGKEARRSFARRIGVAENTLRNYEEGLSLPNSDVISEVHKQTGASLAWLITGEGSLGQHDQSKNATPDNVPIIGLASCSIAGWFNHAPVALTAPIPAGCSSGSIFAVVTVGLSMCPSGICPGYVLYCNPDIQPESKDIIFIEKSDGTASIKHLSAMGENLVTVQGWLDPDENGRQLPYSEQIPIAAVKRIACVFCVRIKA